MSIRIARLTRAAAGACLLACGSLALAQGPAAAPSASASAASAPTASAADQRDGTFKSVQGDVTVVRGNVRSAAIVGGPLRVADRVLTGEGAAAAITLTDGTILTVGPNSSVDLSEFRFDTGTHDGNVLINLARGSLRVVTGLIAKLKPEQVKVTTPTTVIGVRGTDFIVEQGS